MTWEGRSKEKRKGGRDEGGTREARREGRERRREEGTREGEERERRRGRRERDRKGDRQEYIMLTLCNSTLVRNTYPEFS